MVGGNQQQGQPIVLEAKLQVVELGGGLGGEAQQPRPQKRGRKQLGPGVLHQLDGRVRRQPDFFFGKRDGRFEAPGPVGEADLHGA